MELNRLVFAGLSVGCLAAAAGGAYLAVRHAQPVGTVDSGNATVLSTSQTAAPSNTAGTVTASEGVISTDPAKPSTPPAPPQVRRPVPAPSQMPASRAAAARPAASAPREPIEKPVLPPSSSAPQTAANTGSMWETRPSVQPSSPDTRDPEPPPAPVVEFLDLTVPSDAVLGLQVDRTVSSERARVEDRVDARVTRDVRVGNRVAIPAGSSVRGSVTEVDRGGKVRGRARLAIRFHTIVLADGTELNLKTDAVVREGQSPVNETTAKVGGAAVGGAILGAILGGGKGAAIGGEVGAVAGTAVTMAGDRNPATLPAGTTVTVRMQAPVTVTVQKE